MAIHTLDQYATKPDGKPKYANSAQACNPVMPKLVKSNEHAESDKKREKSDEHDDGLKESDKYKAI